MLTVARPQHVRTPSTYNKPTQQKRDNLPHIVTPGKREHIIINP